MRRQSDHTVRQAPRGNRRGGRKMPRKYFGTDGIRGSANTYPMTSEVALKVGMAAGKLFSSDSRLNCGKRRDMGKARMSTSVWIACARKVSARSSKERVECPIV